MMKYPVYQPNLSGNEKKYVNDCLESNWISSKGKYVSQFEQDFASYIGVDHAVGVSNGTVALHLAMVALGIGDEDEVIVPTLTYIASVNAIAYTRAKPVFVDSLKETWQMDPEEIKQKITDRTKAIMVVHLYGHPCDMDAILKIADEHGLFVIEDTAEALGSEYKSRKVGSFGDISTFSFYGNKTITTGEGGMLATNDDTLYDRIQHFKGQGLAKYREYWHDVIGYNYRMTNICAAIGLAQLERIEETLLKKRKIVDWYVAHLDLSKVGYHEEAHDVYHSYWVLSILVNDPNLREPLRRHLSDLGIETRPVFYPVHTMPMYAREFVRFPNAEKIGWRGISLPSYPDLTEADVTFISKAINDFLKIK